MNRAKLLLAPLLIALPAAAAAQTMDSTGTMRGTDRSEVFTIATDHMVVLLMADYAGMALEDPDSPLQGAGGPCFGKVEIRAGAADGDGYCIWRDADGDATLSRWVATGTTEAGGIEGTWESVGGSGKWVGVTGGGSYRADPVGDTDARELSFTGEVTMQ